MTDGSEMGAQSWNVARQVVASPQELVTAFVNGEQIEAGPDLFIRFIRIRPGDRDDPTKSGDEARLANDHRRTVFVAGHDAATAISGLEVEPALLSIGWSAGYVDGLKREGIDVDLVAWNGLGNAQLATWQNVLTAIYHAYERDYPELVEDIRMHWWTLSSRPFEWYGLDAAALDTVEATGPSHPDYLSLDRYLRDISPEARASDVRHLRHLLVFLEHLGPLFTGTGQNVDDSNEYIMPNCQLRELGNVAHATVMNNSSAPAS